MNTLIRSFFIKDLMELPKTVKYYKKTKNGVMIFKDIMSDKFYVVRKTFGGYKVDEYKGECRC